MPNSTFVHLLIRGSVQGVGFRSFVRHKARTLGLSGQVRNLADGAVEVAAEGSDEDLRQLSALAAIGPATARVTGIREEWSEGPQQFGSFEIIR